jgi:hypothetical protein
VRASPCRTAIAVGLIGRNGTGKSFAAVGDRGNPGARRRRARAARRHRRGDGRAGARAAGRVVVT